MDSGIRRCRNPASFSQSQESCGPTAEDVLIMHCKRMPLAVRKGVPRIPIVKAVVMVVRMSYPASSPGFPDHSGNVFRHLVAHGTPSC